MFLISLLQFLDHLSDMITLRSHEIFTPERWHQLTYLYAKPLKPPLRDHVKKVYSQNGEEGILQEIFRRIKTTNTFCIEFGAHDGKWLSNTKLFRDQGWKALLLDSDIPGHKPEINLYRVHLTPVNIEAVFFNHNVPLSFDLLSIDVDGNDFWLWRAIQNYRPRVVIIEFNSALPNHIPLCVAYSDKNGDVPTSHYYGANLLALLKLAKEKKYEFVTLLSDNLIFVTEEDHPKLNLPKLTHENIIKNYFQPCKELFHRKDNLNRLWITPFLVYVPKISKLVLHSSPSINKEALS